MSNHLSLVISKIQYAMIPENRFKKEISAIQDELRKIYPHVSSRTTIQTIDWQINSSSGEQSVNPRVIPRICMASADRQWIIQIMPDNIILVTTNYSDFLDFSEKMKNLLNTIHKILDITHTSFIGIRYINKLSILKQGNLIKNPEFLQPDLYEYAKGGSNLNAKYQTPDGWLNINSGISIDAPKMTHDVQEFIAEWQPNNEVLNGPWAHVDIDSFNIRHELVEFNSHKVISELGRLRKHAKDTFISIISI